MEGCPACRRLVYEPSVFQAINPEVILPAMPRLHTKAASAGTSIAKPRAVTLGRQNNTARQETSVAARCAAVMADSRSVRERPR